MSAMDDEEKEALRSVYSRPGEVEIAGCIVTVNLILNAEHTLATKRDCGTATLAAPVCFVFSIKHDYPDSLPDISIVSEHLARDQVMKIKAKVIEATTDLLGLPMILSLVALAEEYSLEELVSCMEVTGDVSTDSTKVSAKPTVWNSVLHIDHMRSKNKYCKTLEKWSSELALSGRILFCSRLILVILQGEIDSLKDFVVRLKTTSIDVDSKGHSCKERMMKPLCETELYINDSQRFTDFKKQELPTEIELIEVFDEAGLSEIYKSISSMIRGYL